MRIPMIEPLQLYNPTTGATVLQVDVDGRLTIYDADGNATYDFKVKGEGRAILPRATLLTDPVSGERLQVATVGPE